MMLSNFELIELKKDYLAMSSSKKIKKEEKENIKAILNLIRNNLKRNNE